MKSPYTLVFGVGVVLLPFLGGYTLGTGGGATPDQPLVFGSSMSSGSTMGSGSATQGSGVTPSGGDTGTLPTGGAGAEGRGGVEALGVLDHTFSIVAVDPETGEVGVAVTTRNACVGNRVPWVRAGVGAVATQASTRPEYGAELLDRLEGGARPAAALAAAVAEDEAAHRRQVAVVSISGQTAQHTGSDASSWAGERRGDNFATQGNILTGPEVLDEVARVMEETASSGRALSDRLIAALLAGHAAGGDKRKGRRQSAAVLIADPRPGRSTRPDGQSVFLHVCEHADPVAELQRQYESVSQTLGYRDLHLFSGSDVWQLKVLLNALGFYRPHEEALTRSPNSQRFDLETAEAVDRFREARGLSTPADGSPSGLVDRVTVQHLWTALDASGRGREIRTLLRDATAIRN